ncbi:MAG: dTMP kinase [Desulfobacterales bacterium]|nr:dTMP kinase [Desulfobacterales bacterium]
MPGKFISIEGGDGAGKSTQLQVIAETLQANGIEFVMTREPGGTPVGEVLRDLLLNQTEHVISGDTELLLMFAARAEHVNSVIKPALEKGEWVVSDRFSDASFAYQGARGLALSRIQNLADWVLQGFAPDLTLFFDLPLEQGLERVYKRGEVDRFEKEPLCYKGRVQEIYRERAAAEPERILLIDASRDIEGVSRQVRDKIQAYIDSMGLPV